MGTYYDVMVKMIENKDALFADGELNLENLRLGNLATFDTSNLNNILLNDRNNDHADSDQVNRDSFTTVFTEADIFAEMA